jgi:hypothetical protein
MGTKLRFKPGSWYRVCDRTGMVYRAEHTQKQWNNIIVRNRSFEERQPQDFVRGRRDDQTVPEPRPRQTNVFLGVQTTVLCSIVLTPAPGWTVSSGVSGGFSSGFSSGFLSGVGLQVVSAVGFNNGDQISIQLDNGTTFFTSVAGVNLPLNTIFPVQPLPFPASGGNVVTDMTSFTNV